MKRHQLYHNFVCTYCFCLGENNNPNCTFDPTYNGNKRRHKVHLKNSNMRSSFGPMLN